MQNSYGITWKVATKASNMPSQDVWKFTPVSYRTSALWGRCPALTPLLQLITPSRASGTADHVRSLDDLFLFKFSFFSVPPPLRLRSQPRGSNSALRPQSKPVGSNYSLEAQTVALRLQSALRLGFESLGWDVNL